MARNVRRTPGDVKGGTARRRRARNSLSKDAILDAGEALAAEGFGAVTMRAVAARLGAAPMALYNHFATKDELVDALLDRVLGRFQPEPETGDWRTDLRRFAHAHRRLLEQHPWAVAPLFMQPNPGLSAVRIGEHALGILRRAGLSDAQAVAAFSGIIALNYGWSSFTTARDHVPGARGNEVAAMLAMLPASEYPLSVAVAAEMGAYGSAEHYAFVLDRLLDGLRGAGGGGRGRPD
ncbi:MAG TPA: TetR/AcrR family transcriptional regulator [Geminicoccaceae bacterium]|nr:TetR/AcrR family transcriptional regulator [Geminicoccaceae bacterium]